MDFQQLPLASPPSGLNLTRLVTEGQPAFLPIHPKEPVDLGLCFRSGQIFRWRWAAGAWCGPFGSTALALTPVAEGVQIQVAGPPVRLDDVWRFLGLHLSLQEIYQRIGTDPCVRQAIAALPGLRILRQDPWDCLLGYLCSAWNNVPKVELSTERIARQWGTLRILDRREGEVEVACLPPPEALARVEPAELRACALGYRCPYLPATARRVALGEVDLAGLRQATYEEALAVLLRLPGVGRKVADCVLLFSLDRPEAFPVDVWVRRVMRERYGKPLERLLPDFHQRGARELSSTEYRAIARFARERWGLLAGWAGEYLFIARRQGLL